MNRKNEHLYSSLGLGLLPGIGSGNTGMDASFLLNDKEVARLLELYTALCPVPTPSVSDPVARIGWLRSLETVQFALMGAERLENSPEVDILKNGLKKILCDREQFLRNAGGWWRVTVEARTGSERREADATPWCWISSGVGCGELKASLSVEDINSVMSLWVAGYLLPEDAAAIRNWALSPSAWHESYLREIEGLLNHSVIDLPGALRREAIADLILPHDGTRLSVRQIDGGIELSVGNTVLALPWDNGRIQTTLEIPGLGELGCQFERIDPDAHVQARSAIAAIRTIEEAPDYPVEEAKDVISAIRDLLTGPSAWHSAVLRVARCFEAGETVEEDDLWLIARTVEFRAILESVQYRYLDLAIQRDIRKIDTSAVAFASAVLAIPRDEYNELMQDIEVADHDVWWAAPMQLDAAVPDELLHEALIDDVSPAVSPPVASQLNRLRAAWVKVPGGDRIREPSPVYGHGDALDAGSVSCFERIQTGKEPIQAAASRHKTDRSVDYYSPGGNWNALVTEDIKAGLCRCAVTRRDGPIEEGTRIWLFGNDVSLDAGGESPEVSVSLGAVTEKIDESLPHLAVLLPDGTIECLIPEK